MLLFSSHNYADDRNPECPEASPAEYDTLEESVRVVYVFHYSEYARKKAAVKNYLA